MRSHQGEGAGDLGPRSAGTSRASIAEAACLAVQRPSPQCTRCRDACPPQAITIAGRQVAIAEASCLGCGRCAAVCPTGAIDVAGFALPPVARASKTRLECTRVPSASAGKDAIRVPCLCGLSVNRLLALVAATGEDIVIVDRGWCRTCPAGGMEAPWSAAVAAVNRLVELASGGGGPTISRELAPLAASSALAPPRPEAEPALSRRQLLTRIVATPNSKRPTLPSARPAWRPTTTVTTRSLEARREHLAALSQGRPLPAALFPSVAVASTCCDNQVCVRSCPTVALSSVDEPNRTGIDFDAALCIACRECARACPTRSITVCTGGEGLYSGPIALRRARRAVCRECERDFTPRADETVCEACRKDKDLAAAGSALMRRTLEMS